MSLKSYHEVERTESSTQAAVSSQANANDLSDRSEDVKAVDCLGQTEELQQSILGFIY